MAEGAPAAVSRAQASRARRQASVRRIGDAGLNLIPLLTLIAMLIPLVLLSGRYTSYSVIDSAIPRLHRAGVGGEGSAAVAVRIDTRGFQVLGEDDVLSAEMARIACEPTPCQDLESYDFIGLVDRLTRVKARWPGRRELLLAPTSPVPYEVIVRTIDVCRQTDAAPGRPRQELFPAVSFTAAEE